MRQKIQEIYDPWDISSFSNSAQYAILSSKESKFVIVYNLLHCNYNVIHSKPFLTPMTNLEVQVPLFDWGPNIYVYCCLLGNEIEWKYPTSVNLIGVEFKALASGSHTITKDFM